MEQGLNRYGSKDMAFGEDFRCWSSLLCGESFVNHWEKSTPVRSARCVNTSPSCLDDICLPQSRHVRFLQSLTRPPSTYEPFDAGGVNGNLFLMGLFFF